ncbi:hypothetical protein [Olleya sp. YS]|uniref:hypothetical protein n=1 Tax=Olleya sp. YS TaxID=3028318 RepID=UPI002434516F|nr:hypothetical protein [Olleya sp. YS]WGD34143.1 hypothetical protein Ollyesu_10185 [Olleya sp. YS]
MPTNTNYQNYISMLNSVAYRIKNEQMVPVYSTNAYGLPTIKLVPRVEKMKPEIFLIEEYEIKSVLGDYGAGKVIKTMNFGPNEERTITVSSYKKRETTKSFSKNVLDSYSEESAEELESLVENEGTSNISNTTSLIKSAEVSAEITGGISKNNKASASGSASISSSANSAREEMARQLSTAMDKHTAKSSANREMEINSTSTETVSEGSEESIVRVLKNPNFKTLNMVMRQMEQEYITAIILKDVKIGFCNGTKESIRYAKLYELDQLLDDVLVKEECKAKVKCSVITSLMKVRDMAGTVHPFIEEVTENNYKCTTDKDGNTELEVSKDKTRYWRKRKDLIQTLSDVNKDFKDRDFITTNGLIMDLKVRVLRTDGIVADAFLGHGETLDCFNQKLQDEATKTEIIKNQELELKNQEMKLKLKIIESITDPDKQADAYQKMFMEKCVE